MSVSFDIGHDSHERVASENLLRRIYRRGVILTCQSFELLCIGRPYRCPEFLERLERALHAREIRLRGDVSLIGRENWEKAPR